MNEESESEPTKDQPDQDLLPEPLAKSWSQATGQLLMKMLGPAADEIGALLAERVRAWQFRKKNLESIGEKTNAEIDRRGLEFDDLRPLPEGDAYRATDACSLEDDETVQQLWAGLFASAMDPNGTVAASKVFVDILKAVGPEEVGLLLVLHRIDKTKIEPAEKTNQAYAVARKKALEEVSALAERTWRRFPGAQKADVVQNLMRLRCIGFRTGKRLDERKLLGIQPVGMGRDQTPARADAVAKALDYVENLALAASGTGRHQPLSTRGVATKEVPETIYQLTSLGRSLMEACVVNFDGFSQDDQPRT